MKLPSAPPVYGSMRSALVALVLLALPASSLGSPSVASADRLLVRGARAARIGDPVRLEVVLERVVSRRLTRLETLPEGSTVRWLRVVPRLAHVDHAPPNQGEPAFSNAVLYGPHHGDWLGFDTLEYTEEPFEGVAVAGSKLTLTQVPTRARTPEDRFRPEGAGSVWISAEATLPDGRTVRAPGARDVDRYGLSASVARVSFRTGDDYLGWLSTYFHVPNVFGSSGPGRNHQTDRYVGADCADVLVGGRRASGADIPYVSVAGLGVVAEPVSDVYALGPGGVTDASGRAVALVWGRDVLPGDLLALDYTGHDAALPRDFDHVGALVGDATTGARGVLDGADALRNMTHAGLLDVPLAEEGVIRFRVWRWKTARRART